MQQKGFTIIELIITIAILSFGIIGVYGAFSPLVSLNYTVSSRFTASLLAQEGFEIVRNIRDSNAAKIAGGQRIAWSDGLVQCSLGCQLDYKTGTGQQAFENSLRLYDESDRLRINADGFYSYDQGTTTPFTRKITINPVTGSDALKVVVDIFWKYGGKPLNFQTEGYLYHVQ